MTQSRQADFDLETLRETREMMGSRFPLLAQAYLDDARAYLAEIRLGLETQDAKRVAAAAHPLKSSSASLGLLGLAVLARQIEETARQGDALALCLASIDALPVTLEKAAAWLTGRAE